MKIGSTELLFAANKMFIGFLHLTWQWQKLLSESAV
jgi:hypothetical protein